MNKKKVGAAVAALGVAGAVLLTGTYAWQSLNQEALNEASGTVNPGGRLHDDFDYNNDVKRIYVENFGDQNIYARIQLSEYMELGTGAGVDLTSTDSRNVELVTTTSDYNDKSTWQIHYYDSANETDEYMTLDFGGDAVPYMPTFNKNKDSLQADVNGTYAQKYADYVSYDNRVGEEIEGTEIKDNDTNTIDEFEDGSEALDVTYTETVANHTVGMTKASCVISLTEWAAKTDEEKNTTECWVYDTDGWAYWSQPITPNTATGTLINDIDVKNVDDNWFYALNAKAQFITADDLGRNDGTGFYDLDKGSEPTQDALNLLQFIGVDTSEVIIDTIVVTHDETSLYHTQGYLDENTTTLQLYAKEYNLKGEEISSEVTWSINPEIEGVSISDTGLLTVTPELLQASRLEINIMVETENHVSSYIVQYGEPPVEPGPVTVMIDGNVVDFNVTNEFDYTTGSVVNLSTAEGYENATWTVGNRTEEENALITNNGDGTATFTVPEGSEGANWRIDLTVPFGEGSSQFSISINWVADTTE